MMKARFFFSILIGLVLFSFPALSQEKKDKMASLEKMLQLYRNAKTYSMNVTVAVSGFEDAPSLQMKGNVKRSGDHFLSTMQGKTSLINSRCFLMIDKDRQTITYSKRGKSDRKQRDALAQSADPMADTAVFASSSMKWKRSENGKDVYVAEPAGHSLYKSIEVSIDAVSGNLESVIYRYRSTDEIPPATVKISYSDITIDKTIPDSDFSESAFIQIKNDKAVAVGAYKSYQVIEQQIPQPE